MIAHLRRAEQDLGKRCRILMDLAGPKLRTGPIEPGPRVLKWRPRRDAYGRVTAPARIWLMPANHPEPPPSTADAFLPIHGRGLAELCAGDGLAFTDTRGASRSLEVVAAVGGCRWAEAFQNGLCGPRHSLADRAPKGRQAILAAASSDTLEVGNLPARDQALILREDDTLILTRELIPGKPATCDAQGRLLAPATIGCTLPEVFACARPHERIWFDDGKIGGVITSVSAEQIHVQITEAKAGGAKLRADKGINLPDSDLKMPALTAKDLDDLPFVAQNADLIGYLVRARARRRSRAPVAPRATRRRTRRAGAEDRDQTGVPGLTRPAARGDALAQRRRDDRAGRPGDRVRLRTAGRGAGGGALDLRSGPCSRDLGDAGAGKSGQGRSAVARRDHRRRHGPAGRVRHAQ